MWHCSLPGLGKKPEAAFQMQSHCWQKRAWFAEAEVTAANSLPGGEIAESGFERGTFPGGRTACAQLCQSETT